MPGAGLLEVPQRRVGHAIRRLHVDPRHLADRVDVDGLDLPGEHHAGVVDQSINSSVRHKRLLN